ncbi:MAG: SusC/RagA family protein [Cytophagaceae bacterium]|nr:SusC/RagA family protein [Cytophagaceae bacterium]|tara:strand:+ start:3215 stop:6253 length:3039 start_codon:yes stop_codon:yes gene_type:complete
MTKKLYLSFLILLAVLSFSVKAHAQKKNKEKVTITSTIVDEEGNPIPNAKITLGEGKIEKLSDKQGRFSFKTNLEGKLHIEAQGYKSQWVELKKIASETVLQKTLLYSSETDLVNLPLGMQTTQRELTGAVSGIEGTALESYPDLSISNALQGRILGLQARKSVSGLGNNNALLYIRGLHRGNGSDGVVVLVDGIERNLNTLIAQEIEKIEVLKDATSKILYGPHAANGVVLVTTKKGKANTRVLKIGAEYGVSMVTRMPEYLDSYQYAQLYNEARTNDGLSPFYSSQDLDGYRNSTGPNDQRYPNADYYDYFLEEAAAFRRASVEYSGGNDKSQYALVLGYVGGDGIEKVGEKPTRHRFNLRGNLNFEVSDFMSINLGTAGFVETERPTRNNGTVISALSSHRPNEYPFILTDPSLMTENSDFPPLGGSFQRPDNLYADMMYGGFSESQAFYGQANLGIDLDFSDFLLDGLTAKAYYTTDNYQYFSNGKSETAPTYAQRWFETETGEDVQYYQLRRRVIEDNQRRLNEDYTNNSGFYAGVNYENTFGKHAFSAGVNHIYYINDDDDVAQDLRFTNTVLNIKYGFANKLYAEATMAYMGSDKLSSSNRYQLFPAVGLGWVLSEENFMKDIEAIDFLKLKGSFGIMGYDNSMPYYLYVNRWNTNGNVQFNERNNTTISRTILEQTGNPDIGWEKSREYNIGLEGLMFDNRLQFEVNYFNEYRYDIIQSPSDRYSVTAGGLYPLENYGETLNRGFEAGVNWSDVIGDLNYNIGGLVLFSKNKIVKTNEVDYPANQEFIKQTGLPSDSMLGFVAEGLFTSQEQVDNHAIQRFGEYGVGNIAYKDLNGDGYIDNLDRARIGNSFPRTTLGVNINLDYKRFALFVLGTAEVGVDNFLNNGYYWNYGERKYSVQALDRYHPKNNPQGTYPALTTTNGNNDFRNSTYWLQDASFFRLKNVELSYTLPAKSVAKSYKFHVRGTNLFVISKNKDLDPEVNNAGIANYPVFRTVTGGVTVNF